MLLVPGFLPRYYSRTDIIYKILAISIHSGSYAENAVIVAVVHLNLLTAALKEGLGDIESVAVRVLGSHRSLGYKYL